jgi:hypothetical protein
MACSRVPGGHGCFRKGHVHRDHRVACKVRLREEEHMGQVADAKEDPTVCDQWLVQCRTSAGCSGPIAVSSLAALVEALRKAQVGLRA